MSPESITFNVGQPIHKQPLKLTAINTNGKWVFELKKHAVDQRDDTDTIVGLTIENVKAIGEAAKAITNAPI